MAAQEWVGKRVVQKHKILPLQNNGRAVPVSGEDFSIYRVERVQGRRLWLKAEAFGPGGWADLDEVVPLDQAIAFFTDQIQAYPQDVFFPSVGLRSGPFRKTMTVPWRTVTRPSGSILGLTPMSAVPTSGI